MLGCTYGQEWGFWNGPTGPLGGAGVRCRRLQEQEQEMLRKRFLKPQIWACLDAFLLRTCGAQEPRCTAGALDLPRHG